jgi:hypothetical protein
MQAQESQNEPTANDELNSWLAQVLGYSESQRESLFILFVGPFLVFPLHGFCAGESR